MQERKINFVFFGSSEFSKHVLHALEKHGLKPILNISNARPPLDLDKLREVNADVFIVASFGKILPNDLINLPPHKTLNVHPSLLPKLRGPAPIQNTILLGEKPGVSIMRLDEKMDHGPIVSKKEVPTEGNPRYEELEKVLGEAGGELLSEILPLWVKGVVRETPQDHAQATYTKMIRREDGLIDLSSNAEENMRKLRAYSVWPGIYTFFNTRNNKNLRVVIKDAEITDNKFIPTWVIPEGRKEMPWQDFLRGNL